jgi:hypothetical protein
MNCAKMMSMVVLMGAMNMGATGKEIQSADGKMIASLTEDGKNITISNIATRAMLKTIPYKGACGAFTDIAFKNNQTLSATIVAGTCPDHMESTTRDYSIDNRETSCYMQ